MSNSIHVSTSTKITIPGKIRIADLVIILSTTPDRAEITNITFSYEKESDKSVVEFEYNYQVTEAKNSIDDDTSTDELIHNIRVEAAESM